MFTEHLLYAVLYLILKLNPRCGHYRYYAHFTDEDAEA